MSAQAEKEKTERAEKRKRRLEGDDNDAYAELYPSGIGMLDAVGGESDEEADYSKMDMVYSFLSFLHSFR